MSFLKKYLAVLSILSFSLFPFTTFAENLVEKTLTKIFIDPFILYIKDNPLYSMFLSLILVFGGYYAWSMYSSIKAGCFNGEVYMRHMLTPLTIIYVTLVLIILFIRFCY